VNYLLESSVHWSPSIFKTSYNFQCDLVTENGLALKFFDKNCLANINHKFNIDNQSESFCLKAVEKDGRALEYVNNKTPKICMAAVQQDGLALEYIKDQTLELCMAAVEQQKPSDNLSPADQKLTNKALRYVDHQKEIICLAAVKTNGMSLEYVKYQTPDICLAAVKQNGYALQYVHDQKHQTFVWQQLNKMDMHYNMFMIKNTRHLFGSS
jgi:hypothetical protein